MNPADVSLIHDALPSRAQERAQLLVSNPLDGVFDKFDILTFSGEYGSELLIRN